MDIDILSLKKDLEDYYGTAINSNPFAMADLVNLDNLKDEELVNLAINNGFDLDNYIIKKM